MRDHGVTVPRGYNPVATKTPLPHGDSAAIACAEHFPHLPMFSTAEQQGYRRFARCMRRRGFPVDGITFVPGGVRITYAKGVRGTPRFFASQAACEAVRTPAPPTPRAVR
jgi:hypothetical protein